MIACNFQIDLIKNSLLLRIRKYGFGQFQKNLISANSITDKRRSLSILGGMKVVNQPVVKNEQIVIQPKGKVRWTVIFWLLLGGIINYLDRSNMSIAAPEIMRELHFTNTDIGLFGALFSWTYAIMQLPSGWLVDRFGAKKVFLVAVTGWSAATALTGVCSKLTSFLGIRTLLGIFEAPCMPTCAKITSYWFPRTERGFATSVWDSGSKWGPAIAPPILVSIMVAYGWRELFYITGIIGIVYALLFWYNYRNPEDHKTISSEELDYIKAGGAGAEQNIKHSKISWGSLFKYRSVWGMILGYFCTIWIWNIFLNFLPLYLVNTQHVTLTQLGFYASIPWIGGITGEVSGGWLTKKIAESGLASPITSKRLIISICAIITGIAVVMVPFVHSIEATITLFTIALFCISSMQGGSWALAGDIAPASMVASVGAIQNFGGYFGGAFSPIITGMIVDATGSYMLAFVSGGIITACAGLCYWFIVKNPIEAIEA
jgi:sugar phosphate permease